MKLIDLTHMMDENMPLYPGMERPGFDIAMSIEADGFQETAMRLYSHTGTHMDAPAHLFADADTLDRLDISRFIGAGCVVDCSGAGEGGSITMEHIEAVREAADRAEFLLFYTGWDRRWQDADYFGAYPAFDEAVVRYCIKNKKGIGIDAISVDPLASAALPAHRLILGAGLVIIENLKGLGRLLNRDFIFAAFPLKYKNADGSPVRAVAIEM